MGGAKITIERTEKRFDLKPKRLAADTAYGSAATLNWLVNEKKIQSRRDNGPPFGLTQSATQLFSESHQPVQLKFQD